MPRLGTLSIAVGLVVLGSGLSGGLASAGGGALTLDLEWQAPARCPDKPALIDDVNVLLSHARGGGGEPVHARGAIVPSRGGYTLILDVEGARRQLEGSSCDSLARAAALFIALVLDPQLKVAPEPLAAASEARPAPSAPPVTGAPSSSQPSRPAPSAITGAPSSSQPSRPAPSAVTGAPSSSQPSGSASGPPTPPPYRHGPSPSGPSRQDTIWYAGGAVIDIGTLPQWSVFGVMGPAWERPPFRLAVRALLAAPQHWNVGSDARVTFHAFGASTRICLGQSSAASRAGACVGIEALRVDGESSSLTSPARGGGWAVAAEVGGDWRARVWGAWSVAVEAAVTVPVVRLHFLVDGGAEHRTGVALRAGVLATRSFQVF